MSEERFVVPYQLGDKDRLFDLGQGISSGAAMIMRNRGGKVQSFSRSLRRMKIQALLFAALAALQGLLLAVGGISVLKIVLLVLCVLLGGWMWAVWNASSKAYEKASTLYVESNGREGTITFDEDGITECSESGTETHFDWEDYRCCVMCPEAIVVVSYRPVMLIVSREEETERGICQALTFYDKEDTIFEVEIREKKR